MSKTDSTSISEIAKIAFLSVLIIVSTFPSTEWIYSIGIDPPLFWVYNHIFDNGFEIGKNFIFPHGPLAFFMYPLPQNITISTVVDSILKFSIFVNFYLLLQNERSVIKWLGSLISAYAIATIAGFNHLILANVILLYCGAYSNKHYYLKYLAFILTAFAFYVKAYVGIISVVISISFIVYKLVETRNSKVFILDGILILALIITFWIALYGSATGFLRFLQGMIHLAEDNSSAAAYYPNNNWLTLSFFIGLIGILPLINRSKKFQFYTILIGLSLFAAWKHGMARQDVFHIRGLFTYLIICSIILLAFHKKNTLINLITLSTAIIIFSINARVSVGYSSPDYDYFRASNFWKFITQFEELKQESETISKNNIESNKLPSFVTASIGNSTVDIYPWDYSIISANNLNWKPRVVINSYAAYTSWLDQQNADHFSSSNAPDYLVIEKHDYKNVNGGLLTSIDGRYLLNDEPKTFLEILTNYEYWYSNQKFLIVKRKVTAEKTNSQITSTSQTTWSQWQAVPRIKKGQLIRAKLSFNKSFIQRLKSFVYKDEQFWIYLKLENDLIHKYRIVPKNAVDGLWINPYIYNFNTKLKVKEVLFKASNEAILAKDLTVQWELFSFDNKDLIGEFFNQKLDKKAVTQAQNIQSFEKTGKHPFWSDINDIYKDNSFDKEGSLYLKPNSFSCTFTYPLDSIPSTELEISADCWTLPLDYQMTSNIDLVITVESNQEKNIIWESIPIDQQIIDTKHWNHIYNMTNYQNSVPNRTVSGYLWNRSDEPVLIDNFRFSIISN